jgi:hypothetical protein
MASPQRTPAKRQRTTPTLGALQSAMEEPDARAPAVPLVKPSRDSVIVGWCLDYELNGSDRFVENYYNEPAWIHTIDLANVSISYLESTVSPGWYTSGQGWYPRKRALRVLKAVWCDQTEEYQDEDSGFWPALYEKYWPDGLTPSWDTLEIVCGEFAADIERLRAVRDEADESDVSES